MTPSTMRAARLHGIRDLRLETLPVPEPGFGELLVRVEGCGVCPTDVRKFRLGLDDGGYPLNPGHEWVGRVAAVGPGAESWRLGDRVYGDTYAGYAEYALLRAAAGGWSAGAVAVDDDLAVECAVFVEPLADCLHAIQDQGRAGPEDRVLVLGAGQMGLQLVAAAAVAGADVLVAEPLAERRALAREFGAREVVGADDWRQAAAGFAPTVAILSIGDPGLVMPLVEAVEPGGRVVLFAGFGDRASVVLDLNRIHYREVAVVGSEWIGTPPNARPERYAEAAALLRSGRVPVERLVTGRCGLNGLGEAFAAVEERRGLKTVLLPGT